MKRRRGRIKPFFSDEEYEWMRQNLSGLYTTVQMVSIFQMIFHREFTVTQTGNIMRHHGIKNLPNFNSGRFVKGQKSWNKGKKMSEAFKNNPNIKKNQFKKGGFPGHVLPEGAMVVDGENRVYIKLKGHRKKTNYPRWVYEQAYGKLPKDWMVIHLDGNRLNNDLSNLRAVSKSVNAIKNCFSRWNDFYPETAEGNNALYTMAEIHDVLKKAKDG